MAERTVKLPSAEHPITINRTVGEVIVTVAGIIVAKTTNALTLKEASYPAVQYIPREDVDMSLLAKTDHQTYCPYKGDSSYYSIPGGGERSVNAAWSYESPFPAMDQIKNHLAFYPDRVDSIGQR